MKAYNDGKYTYYLTEVGEKKIKNYIKELEAKRKEILDAKKDTADETNLPTVKDVFVDIVQFGFDEDREGYNSWGVTDNYNADYPITLTLKDDVVMEANLGRIYDSKRVLREKRVGDWIVTIEPWGVGKNIYVYNHVTLHEHYKKYNGVLTCSEDATEDVKAFYKEAEDRDFDSVCDMIGKWGNGCWE